MSLSTDFDPCHICGELNYKAFVCPTPCKKKCGENTNKCGKCLFGSEKCDVQKALEKSPIPYKNGPKTKDETNEELNLFIETEGDKEYRLVYGAEKLQDAIEEYQQYEYLFLSNSRNNYEKHNYIAIFIIENKKEIIKSHETETYIRGLSFKTEYYKSLISEGIAKRNGVK